MMNEQEAREEICRVGKSLFDRGYVHATAGNISVKLEDGFLITPTDACLGFLVPERLAKVDLTGKQIGGSPASKTLALHSKIYQANERNRLPARCVIHTHSTYCVALTLQCRDEYLLPALTPYFVMKVGRVPLLPYRRPGDPVVGDMAMAAIDAHAAIEKPLRAVMLERLGPNVWHETPAQAMAVLEELEETAKLWLLSSKEPESLSDAATAELRQIFGATW